MTVTYTDVHRRRTQFFMNLLDGQSVEWSTPKEEKSDGLGREPKFYLVNGCYRAGAENGLDHFLELLGSRIVFLIDWNRARKALYTFVGKSAAIELLQGMAMQGHGHRAFSPVAWISVSRLSDGPRQAAFHMACGSTKPWGVRM